MGKYIDLTQALSDGTFHIASISELSLLKPFDCGNQDLNEFLINDASRYQKYLSYKTFIIESDERTVGYYSLANDSLSISANYDHDFKHKIRKLMKVDSFFRELLCNAIFPAVKLGRLAIDIQFQNHQIGTQILDFLTYSFIHHNKTGCQFITVDALNDIPTLSFYEQNGFEYLSVQDVASPTRQMYKFLLEYL